MGPLAIIAFLFTLAGIIALVAGTGSVPNPFADPATVAGWYAAHAGVIRVGATLQFGSAIPLGIVTASAYARQLRLGVRVPGPVIGLYGGITASLTLAVSAFVTWALAFPEANGSPGAAVMLARLSFVLGGVGYATGLGLLIAGISVPAFILRFFPRWLGAAGLVVAVLGELSFLSLAIEPLQFVLPIVRFAGGAWLIAAVFLLPRQRAKRAPGREHHAPGEGGVL
jgi:hypothetical protein